MPTDLSPKVALEQERYFEERRVFHWWCSVDTKASSVKLKTRVVGKLLTFCIYNEGRCRVLRISAVTHNKNPTRGFS